MQPSDPSDPSISEIALLLLVPRDGGGQDDHLLLKTRHAACDVRDVPADPLGCVGPIYFC